MHAACWQVITKGPQRINPCMCMSAESSAVTGIADEDLVAGPTWEEVAADWRDFLADSCLHGYAAKRFDVPLLRSAWAGARGSAAWATTGTARV